MLVDKKVWFQKITSKRFQRLGREFFWIGLGQVAATLGSFVGVRLLTGVISPDAYGELALGMTLGTLLNQIILGPLSGAALRFFAPARETGELGAFLAALRRLLSKATLVVLIVVVGVSLVLVLTEQVRWLGLVLTAFGFALLSGYNSTLNGLQNAARQRTIVAWHQALYSWAHFLAAVGLVLWLGAYSAVAMLGYMLATLLVLFSQYWFFRRIEKPVGGTVEIETATIRHWESQMLTYAWPFVTWGIFTWAQMASDRWALQLFASTQEVGLYAVLYQLGYYPITILTGLMVQLVSPVFFQRAGDTSDASRVRNVYTLNWRLTIGALLLTSLATLLASGLHGLVFRLLAAPAYREVSWLLPGMVLSGGLFASGQFAAISLLSGIKTRSLIAPKTITAVVGVLLNVVGAALWGVIGVVSASAITAAVYLIWILCLIRIRHNQID